MNYYTIGKFQISNYSIATEAGIFLVKNTETNMVYQISGKQLKDLLNNSNKDIIEKELTKEEIEEFTKRGEQICKIFD